MLKINKKIVSEEFVFRLKQELNVIKRIFINGKNSLHKKHHIRSKITSIERVEAMKRRVRKDVIRDSCPMFNVNN